MRDLIMGLGHRATTAFAVTLLGLAASQPAAAANVTVKNITLGEGYTVSIPSIVATDTSLTEAQLRGLFTGDFLKQAGAIADLDAASLRVPEIRISYELPGETGAPIKQTIVYRNIELTDVVDGVAASASIGDSSVLGNVGMTMSYGKMSANGFDLGGVLAFFGMGTGTPGEFRTIYSDLTFGGATVAGPDFSCDIGGASQAEFRARPPAVGFADIAALIKSIEPGKSTEPEVVGQLIDFYIDILTAFEGSPMSLEGFDCSGTAIEGEAVSVHGGTMDLGAMSPGTYPSISVNDLRVDVAGIGNSSLSNFTLKPIDFNDVLTVLKANKADLSESWFEKNWRKLIPVLDGLAFSDFAIDAPNPDDADMRLVASVGDFDLSLGDYFLGIPTNISAGAHDIVFTIPKGTDLEMLGLIGIDTMRLGYDLAVHWDREAKTIRLDNLSVSAGQMGSFTLSGTLGNATEALFSESEAEAMDASQALTIKDVTVTLDDAGLSYFLIGMMAQEQRQEPLIMRAALSAMVSGMTVGILGNTPDAFKASTQIAAFLNGAPNLTLQFTATSDAGLSIPEIMAAEKDPRVVTGKFTLVAEASGDPIPVPVPLGGPGNGMDRPEPEPEPEPEPTIEPDPERELEPDTGTAPEPEIVPTPPGRPPAELSPTQTNKLTKKN